MPREERADVDQLAVEGFAFLLVVPGMKGKDPAQDIGFKYRDVNASIRKFSSQ
jgi:hypothetical protein